VSDVMREIHSGECYEKLSIISLEVMVCSNAAALNMTVWRGMEHRVNSKGPRMDH